jgi:hypothetical protein
MTNEAKMTVIAITIPAQRQANSLGMNHLYDLTSFQNCGGVLRLTKIMKSAAIPW